MWEVPTRPEDNATVALAERFAASLTEGDFRRAEDYAEAAFRRVEVSEPDDRRAEES
jgi:hypothetical protein